MLDGPTAVQQRRFDALLPTANLCASAERRSESRRPAISTFLIAQTVQSAGRSHTHTLELEINTLQYGVLVVIED